MKKIQEYYNNLLECKLLVEWKKLEVRNNLLKFNQKSYQ